MLAGETLYLDDRIDVVLLEELGDFAEADLADQQRGFHGVKDAGALALKLGLANILR